DEPRGARMNRAAAGATEGTGRDTAPALRGPAPRLGPGTRVLLYGIGNDLRGDDGAGPRLARALEGAVPWTVRVVHGLTPELADELVEADLALFVDAAADPALAVPTWTALDAPAPGTAGQLLGHALDAPGLLAWCVALHGRAPRAALLSLPARDLALGETLTPTAEAGVAAAAAALVAIAGG
ncbi:MAG: hydrogenase maturation protease, partial [Trueperaceae bacterium]